MSLDVNYTQPTASGGFQSTQRSAGAIAHEVRNIKAVRSALKQGHRAKCGMICNAIEAGLTDAEVIDHLRIQKEETTLGSVQTLRSVMRKAGFPVMTNSEVIALRGAF